MSKVIHYINIVLIFLFLIGVCVLEECWVSAALKAAQDDVLEIEEVLNEKDALLDEEVVMLVENLDYDWTRNEKALCYMVNHKSIQEIGVEISRLKSCIVVDNIEDFRVSLEHIKLYCHTYMHFMGASIDNIL